MNGIALVPRLRASKYIQVPTRASSISRSIVATILVMLSNGILKTALPSRMNMITVDAANPSHTIPTIICFPFMASPFRPSTANASRPSFAEPAEVLVLIAYPLASGVPSVLATESGIVRKSQAPTAQMIHRRSRRDRVRVLTHAHTAARTEIVPVEHEDERQRHARAGTSSQNMSMYASACAAPFGRGGLVAWQARSGPSFTFPERAPNCRPLRSPARSANHTLIDGPLPILLQPTEPNSPNCPIHA